MPRVIADADPHVQPLQINVSFPIEEDNFRVLGFNGKMFPVWKDPKRNKTIDTLQSYYFQVHIYILNYIYDSIFDIYI